MSCEELEKRKTEKEKAAKDEEKRNVEKEDPTDYQPLNVTAVTESVAA